MKKYDFSIDTDDLTKISRMLGKDVSTVKGLEELIKLGLAAVEIIASAQEKGEVVGIVTKETAKGIKMTEFAPLKFKQKLIVVK